MKMFTSGGPVAGITISSWKILNELVSSLSQTKLRPQFLLNSATPFATESLRLAWVDLRDLSAREARGKCAEREGRRKKAPASNYLGLSTDFPLPFPFLALRASDLPFSLPSYHKNIH